MNSQVIIDNIRNWLTQNQKSQEWLANQLGITPALLSQILNQKRKLQTKIILELPAIMGMSIELITQNTEEQADVTPQIQLRGHLSKPDSEDKIDALSWDIQRYVSLLEAKQNV
ncbi:hypothetical protein AYR62_02860 [Secundilactobacillus paracollinoides]|uniref:helix-turn-helix domain-containing protein n=1 Tax=Secundilactobacillus paracollinoides TaxID=240427 RepID=UPI0006D0AF3B|nr:helix-turn-helix transcriptional regulator [Secundilactobacillus paracollinoides]ANZ63140.1 hypothetical protein AYR62_02860 [Secundilactobacillus paracollinoides]KRL75563.1 hypothetical protein FC17_GL002621 [Secundilactobacillus paracollinoides DSM 15502 = JCM 11969]